MQVPETSGAFRTGDGGAAPGVDRGIARSWRANSYLLSAVRQDPRIRREWMAVLHQRIRLVAIIWAGLMLAWIPVDLLGLPAQSALLLTVLRVASAAGFAGLAYWPAPQQGTKAGRARFEELWLVWRLLLLFGLQIVFLMLAVAVIGRQDMMAMMPGAARDWAAIALQVAYIDQPLLLAAAIGLFPLFLVQGAGMILLLLCATVVLQLLASPEGLDGTRIGIIWLAVVVGAVGMFCAALQVHLLINLITAATRDRLTKALSRRAGDELGLSEISGSLRHHRRCALAFVDLDRFKAVNDGWGHDAGDRVLSAVASHLQRGVRGEDSVIRWGGEEFVLLLPMTDKAAARRLLERLCRDGLALRPDGSRQTVSVGLAELLEDEVTDWAELVRVADERMYMAKQAGRNRIVDSDTAPDAPVPVQQSLFG